MCGAQNSPSAFSYLCICSIWPYRNFGLLSFGFEAEEDEEQTNTFVQKNAGKAKSTHDVLDDPLLSKQTQKFMKIEPDDEFEDEMSRADEDRRSSAVKDKIRNKLKMVAKSAKETTVAVAALPNEPIDVSDSDDDIVGNELERERKAKLKQQA